MQKSGAERVPGNRRSAMFSKSGIFVGAAAALLGVAAWQSEPASAAALHETEVSSTLPMDTVVNQMAVSYADLDLKRPADVATLYHRIDVAAGFACGSRYFTGSHAVSPFWTACKKQAVNE